MNRSQVSEMLNKMGIAHETNKKGVLTEKRPNQLGADVVKALKALGFMEMPYGMSWHQEPEKFNLRAAYEAMTPEQQALARRVWVEMGGFVD